MKVLVLGGSGVLGSALQRGAPRDARIDAPSSAQADLRDKDAVEKLVRNTDAEWIVNAAAYTQFEAAESNERAARVLNADLPAILGREAAAKDIPVLHVSTDYVFGGVGHRPWREDDACSPQSAYGRTKREGEVRLLESGASALIVRTAWLFGDAGRNFPRTMWERAKRGESSRVVADQRGTPTSAADLASWCWSLMAAGAHGVFHATNAGATTWADVAERVYARAGMPRGVTRVSSDEYPSAAPRPRYSVLDCSRLDAVFSEHAKPSRRTWESALDSYLDLLAE